MVSFNINQSLCNYSKAMFITIKETTKLSKTPCMPRKHLFLPGYRFFKLRSGLLDFHGDFHKQSRVSNGFVKFYNLLEDIFLTCSFLFFCFQITFSFILVALQFPLLPKQVMSEPFCKYLLNS